jgi:hypothetical protein
MMHIGHALAHVFMDTPEEKRQFDATCAAADGFAEGCARIGMNADQIDNAHKMAAAQIEKGLPQCESQIERMMLPWLIYRDYKDLSSYPAFVHLPKEELTFPGTATVIVPQFAIAKYRLDFAIIGRCRGHTKIIAIECDGVAYHDVRKDRIRDKYLADLGIETLRAQGKVINSHGVSIAHEAAQKMAEWRATIVPYKHDFSEGAAA